MESEACQPQNVYEHWAAQKLLQLPWLGDCGFTVEHLAQYEACMAIGFGVYAATLGDVPRVTMGEA
jgi:hypothetical protein